MSDNMDVRWRFDQTFGRDTQGSVQISDHSQSQRPGVVENFVDSVEPTDHWLKILRSQPLLIHTELDRFDWIGHIQR